MKKRFWYMAAFMVALAGTGCRMDEGNRERMVNLEQVNDSPETQLANLTAAIERSRRDGSLYTRRSIVLLRKGELEQALADANEAVRLSKNDPASMFVKAQVLRALGRDSEALPLALQAERNSYQSTSLYVLLGDLYLKHGDYKQAGEYIAKALDISPTDEFALYYRARVQAATGDTARAIQNYKLALEQAPSLVEAKRDLAGMLVALKEFDAARPYVAEAMKDLPKDKSLLYYKGMLYLAEQKKDSAMWAFSTAVAEADTLYGAHYQLGLYLHAQGDNAGAIEHLEKAGKAYGRKPKYMSTLASSYERTGQYQRSLQQYQRLLAAEPGFTYVQYSIARLRSKLERPRLDTTTVYIRNEIN